MQEKIKSDLKNKRKKKSTHEIETFHYRALKIYSILLWPYSFHWVTIKAKWSSKTELFSYDDENDLICININIKTGIFIKTSIHYYIIVLKSCNIKSVNFVILLWHYI